MNKNVRKYLRRVPVGVWVIGTLISGVLVGMPVGYAAKTGNVLDKIGLAKTNQPAGESVAHDAVTFDNLLIKVNEARIANGRKQLAVDSYLSKYAQADLVGNCPVTSHDPFNKNFNSGAFSSYHIVSEDLTSGFGSAGEAVQNFMDSPTHRDALLNPDFGRVGIGFSFYYAGDRYFGCVSLLFSQI